MIFDPIGTQLQATFSKTADLVLRGGCQILQVIF